MSIYDKCLYNFNVDLEKHRVGRAYLPRPPPIPIYSQIIHLSYIRMFSFAVCYIFFARSVKHKGAAVIVTLPGCLISETT
jgi:hypothetical protein